LAVIKKDNLIRTVFVTISGGALAQVITFTTIPFVTRIYDPAVFGVISNINVLANFLVPLLTLSLPFAIVLIDSNKKAKLATSNIILFSLYVTLVLLLVLYIYYLLTQDINTLIFLSSALFLAFNLSNLNACQYLSIRNQWFKSYSIILISQSLLVAIFKIGFGYISPSIESMILATLLGVSLISLFTCINYKIKFYRIQFSSFLSILKEHKSLALFRTPQNLVANFNILMPVTFISYFYTVEDAGLYALARTAIMTPMNVIGKSISDVLYSQFSKLYMENKSIRTLLNRMTLVLAIIGIIPILIIFGVGNELFAIIFGTQWSVSAEYSKYIILMLYFSFCAKPYVALIPIFNLEKPLLTNSIFNSFCIAIGLVIGFVVYDDPLISIAFSSLISIFSQVFIIFISRNRVNKYEEKK
jgi:O-antigen/teichoic acid export membrane protein